MPARWPAAAPANPVQRPVRPWATEIYAPPGSTVTATGIELALGPLRFSTTRAYAQDSIKITAPNGATIEASGVLAHQILSQLLRTGQLTLG
jgi:hypothetical protein